jgi:phenylpropionate dioxygenase-like ring-hydroxylating dioxygenase large terminal subunit
MPTADTIGRDGTLDPGETGKTRVYGADAYVSADYARAESDRLWRKVWQIACRVEEIPDVGDYVVYDIVDDTIVITRSGAEEISAFYNVCAHRGKRLADGCGHTRQFRCSYHAWRYNLKGENTFVLDATDWEPPLPQQRLDLPKVRVDTWGGFVWINMDPDCEPLSDYLSPLAELLDAFEFDKMRYRWRTRGVFNCNWKVALEAFLEAYHVEGTHPQLMKYASYYTWSKPDGLHAHKGFREKKAELNTLESNTYFRPGKGEDQRVAIYEMQEETLRTANASTTETMVKAAARLVDELPETATAAEITAHWLASAKRDDAARGVVWPEISPEHLAECGNSCHLFPNMAVAYGFTFALCYRARPYGDDPNKCIFEGFVVERFPEGEEPKTDWVIANEEDGQDQWPPVLRQDIANFGQVQRGMRSQGFRGNLPNPLQEVMITNFHANLARFMGTEPPAPLA